MALDGVFLKLVRDELKPLIGGRVDKLYQPSREELVIGIRTRDGSYRLLLNCAAGTARVHVTSESIENPKTPPMFCMLMRKHLSSGKLIDIRQDGCERILYFDFDSSNEMGDIVRLTIAAEIMGRRSNIILIDANGRIIDSIKRVTPEMSAVRPVLPGMNYILPPRTQRVSLLDFDADTFKLSVKAFEQKRMSNALVQTIEGISPVFADEVIWRAKCDDKAVCDFTNNEIQCICDYLCEVSSSLYDKKNKLVMLKNTQGQLKDFCFTEIKHYGTLMTTEICDSACELLDDFYSSRDKADRIRQKAQDLFRLLETLIDRTARRIANQKAELKECADRDKLRAYGDLIMTNLYSIEKGVKSFTCTNLFDEQEGEITIDLNPRYTPSQNAQMYYKEYKKADTAEKKLTELIADGNDELAYLESVRDALTRADSESDIEQLRDELSEQGFIRHRTKKSGKASKSLPPIKFVSDDGYTILVGRHNRQNDKLTLKDSQKTDIWLHTQGITGSHTIICTDSTTPPDSTILQAAEIAAFYSGGRNSSQVPVDYTLVKFVKKPNGAKPGMVIFTNQKTLYVKPDEREIERLRVK